MTKLQIEDILVVVAKRNTIFLSKNRQLAQKIYKIGTINQKRGDV